MWRIAHLSLRILAAIAGGFCLLTAFLAYPDEEGRMQTALEDLWTKIDDHQKAALSLHTAFMQEVAKSVSRGFDLLFGHKLFSIRCLGVSIAYSIASVPLAMILSAVYFHFIEEAPFPSPGPQIDFLTIPGSISIAYLFIGTIPILFDGFRFMKTWLFFIVTSACVFWVLGFSLPDWSLSQKLTNLASTGLPAIAASFGSDVLFIAATRQCLRWASEMKQSYRIAVLVLFNFIFAAGFVLVPYIWAFGTTMSEAIGDILAGFGGDSPQPPTQFVLPVDIVLSASASNTIDLLAASIFILLAVLLLVHRVFWPLLNRSIFRFQEVGTKGRRAILVTVGLLLLSASTGDKVVDYAKKISEIFKG